MGHLLNVSFTVLFEPNPQVDVCAPVQVPGLGWRENRAIGHLVLFLSRILVGVVGETGVLSWSASTARSDRMCW